MKNEDDEDDDDEEQDNELPFFIYLKVSSWQLMWTTTCKECGYLVLEWYIFSFKRVQGVNQTPWNISMYLRINLYVESIWLFSPRFFLTSY